MFLSGRNLRPDIGMLDDGCDNDDDDVDISYCVFNLSFKVLKLPKLYDVVKNFSVLSYVNRTLRKILIMCIQYHLINIARMCIVHIVMVKSYTIQVASLHHHLLLQRQLNQNSPPPHCHQYHHHHHHHIPLHLEDKMKEEEDSFIWCQRYQVLMNSYIKA